MRFGSLLGIVGDLFASAIKRQCGIKDYGTIFPGHGGILDRFDSVLFIALCRAGRDGGLSPGERGVIL
ncbi:MAG: phosphatidate cytidylyltransferase [Ruthenibacterium lactatiformans]